MDKRHAGDIHAFEIHIGKRNFPGFSRRVKRPARWPGTPKKSTEGSGMGAVLTNPINALPEGERARNSGIFRYRNNRAGSAGKP
jgi:hypothetical protein